MKRPVRGDLCVSETRENPIFSASSPDDQGAIGANESGTVSESGTKLTQPNPASFTVPADLKHHMRILRKKFGASSKIGRRASNVEEAAHNLQHGIEPGPAGEFQRANLEKTIKRQLTEITQLAAQP